MSRIARVTKARYRDAAHQMSERMASSRGVDHLADIVDKLIA